MRFAIAVAVVSLCIGCASTLTPEQQRVYDAFETCRAATNSSAVLDRVSPDGQSFQITGTVSGSHDVSMISRCLSDRFGYRFR
jgi:hypothetical protein